MDNYYEQDLKLCITTGNNELRIIRRNVLLQVVASFYQLMQFWKGYNSKNVTPTRLRENKLVY